MRNLLHHVEAEWAHDGDGPEARAALASWAERFPALARFSSPAHLVRSCHSRSDPGAVAAAVALAGEARADRWAARTLLAVILPGLARLARTNRDLVGDHHEPFATVAELDQFVLCAAYERIAGGAGSRPTSELWDLLDAVADRLRAHARAHHREGRRRLALNEALADSAAPPRSAAEELTAALVDAVERRVLRVGDARLVYATRVAGRSGVEVAKALACKPNTLRRRRHRVEAVLAADVQGQERPRVRFVAPAGVSA